MAFLIPSRDDLSQAFLDEARAEMPDKNQSRGSDLFRLARVVSGVAWAIVARLVIAVGQLLPDKASGAYQDRWGAIIDVPRLDPGPSQGKAALLVTGAPGTPVPSGAGNPLAHADGTLYQISTVGAVLDAGGNATVDVLAISTGVQTNKRAGDTLTFVTPVAGIASSATLTANLVDGVDVEDDEAYRPRQLSYFTDPPEGGDPIDYEQWALAVPGVAWAGVYPLRSGLGTVDLAVLGPGSGAARILGDTSAVSAAILPKLPAGMKSTAFQILTIGWEAVDVSLRISIDAGSEAKWDWDDGGVATAVTAANSVASWIQVAAVPAGLAVGMRITVGGEEATVAAIAAGGGGFQLTLSFAAPATWFSYGDPTGASIYASGDLVAPVRAAVLARFDGLGPSRASGFAFGVWEDGLRLAKLIAAASDVAGVDDVELDAPAASQSPLDQGGALVNLLVPGKVTVRKL